MPKQVNLLPSLRLDIPDYFQQTAGLSVGGQKHLLERSIQANYPAVVDGFRVEIANQTTSPRLLTVYNGVAFDRSGAILNNEDDYAASRSITLPANGTYFLEVELVSTASDPDARGFWDPTYDNGTDPSGDQRPAGREFNENVATRLTPDWRIVSPVSTTGFEVTTNPDSTKVPIAELVVAGGEITSVSTGPWRTVLRRLFTTSETDGRFFDTRGMPDTFTLRFDPGGLNEEDLSVTANDRENGILTFSASPANDHQPGERAVVQTTPAQFLEPGSAADARPRLFQGNVDDGHYVSLDPEVNTDPASRYRTDQQIASLKHYVDFLANQLQELKFGGQLRTNVGSIPPPVDGYSTNNRYFDAAGSVLGARTNTVSMGTGTESWGDFNVLSPGFAGDAGLTLIAAIAHIDANFTNSGGTLFLKRGSYDINITCTINGPLKIVGEGEGVTFVNLTGASEMFDVQGTVLQLENLTITQGVGGGDNFASFTAGSKFYANHCSMIGFTGALSAGHIMDCTFFTSDIVISADLDNVVMENVQVFADAGASTGRCIDSGSVTNSRFSNCLFSYSGTDMDELVTIGTTDNVVFDTCLFGGGGPDLGNVGIDACASTQFRRCSFTGSGNQLRIPSCDFTTIEDCDFGWDPNNHICVDLGTTSSHVRIHGNFFALNGAYDDAQTSVAISGTNLVWVYIKENNFLNADSVIQVRGTDHFWVEGNVFRNTSGHGRYAVEFLGNDGTFGNILHSYIQDNMFYVWQADTANVRCITITDDAASLPSINGLLIRGNHFRDIGSATAGANRVNTYAIDLTNVHATNVAYGVKIVDNNFWDVQGVTTCFAIAVAFHFNGHIRGNHLIFIASDASALTDWAAISVAESFGMAISDNVIDGAGHDTITGNHGVIIIKKTLVNPGTQRNNYTITGNILRFVNVSSVFSAAILLRDIPGVSTISGNVIDLTNGPGSAIQIVDGDTTADDPQIYELSITGNTLNNNNVSGTWGIFMIYLRDQPSLGGRCSITGNVIQGFSVSGIHLGGPSVANPLLNMACTGNTIATNQGGTGIVVAGVHHVAVTGNSIMMLTAVAEGIVVSGCQHGVVTGNQIRVESGDAAASCIDAADTDNNRLAISGNQCRLGSSGATDGDCIRLPAPHAKIITCFSNTTELATAGAGFAISESGAGAAVAYTRARTNSDSGALPPATPADVLDIGLNYRVAP